MTIGNKIMTLRRENNLSQEILAEKLGVSRQAVSKWEAEQCLPDIDKIVKLSELFGVSTDYILKEDSKSKTDVSKGNISNDQSTDEILLKQIDNEITSAIKEGNSKIISDPTIIATILVIAGFLLFVSFYLSFKMLVPCAVALIIQVIGIGLFYNHQNNIKNEKQKKINSKKFFKINSWFLVSSILFLLYIAIM
ncbi:helix-turn-helix domain-containing protein [Anaerofustis stercorihominis]|uniref:helix-turn-helix domain-containing protein n=1 Tax=Anaerofustis stercorihominis TaxID=214853 RepID=UPI00214C0D68|nr:helix-turn-helix domain-containing protein [Anaerofustis stercorihominis]MCR2033198.1 helix-turn-helix domain-containing protein [Anaerofustis stercorihominis]